ncbi:MAG: Rieske 2Fe-2S domain-containing protein [Acidobacteria bacterium]|nr:Rieske 2Fe-2S domain-containing protein [Acidobacteriota bacterium]
MANYVTVAQVGEVAPGTGAIVVIDDTLVALFNVNGSFHAISNTCLHRGGPLGEGLLEDDVVTCPWHGWRFNVKSGANPFNPQLNVNSYPVLVEGDDVKVSLEP